MFKRFIYWLKHKHPCKSCCLFCKFYERCKEDKEDDEIKGGVIEVVISTDNRCVYCGDIIPEGRQVCPNCEVMYDK